jgi:antitoxin VapB
VGREYPAKSFKSGNSVAIRMPAELGIEPGHEWTIELQGDKLVLEKRPKAKRKFNVDKVWGCAIGSGLQFIKDEDRALEVRPLLWDDPEWRARYMPDE